MIFLTVCILIITPVTETLSEAKEGTHSFQLDITTHPELNRFAHDEDPLVSTNDGLAVTFDHKIGRCVAGDL